MRNQSILISLVMLSLSILGFSQNYPIPANNSQWGEVTFLGPPGLPGAGSYGSIYRYDGKDTVINNQKYQYWQGIYTRYDNNKLITIDPIRSLPDSIIEVVYYDFNLALKDSFLLPLPYDSIYAIVEEISAFKALNGQTRKKIILTVNDFPYSQKLKWIEGIGDISNGIFYLNQLGMSDIYNRVVCFSDSSGSVYKELNFNYPCDSLDNYVKLIDGIFEQITYDSEIKIIPNPVIDKLVVKSNWDFEKIRVLNTNGQVLIESTDNDIDCSNLDGGLYFLELMNSNCTIKVSRFIKK